MQKRNSTTRYYEVQIKPTKNSWASWVFFNLFWVVSKCREEKQEQNTSHSALGHIRLRYYWKDKYKARYQKNAARMNAG